MLTAHSISHGGLGRFGNQCFTLAGTIGIATRNGQPYGFGPWRTVDNALFGDPVDDIEDYLVNPLPRVPEGLLFTDAGYHWEFRNYNVPTGNWNIQAHLQDPLYFIHCMDLIRETLRFKDEPEQNDYVAIHYRAGDYIDDPNAYHPRQSREYYEKAMALFPSKTKFILFSDNMDELIDRLPMRLDCQYIPAAHYHYLEDFKLMKRCHSFITSNSSFSLMAAILGEHPDKKMVCPRKWFGPTAGLKFDGYPQGAVVI